MIRYNLRIATAAVVATMALASLVASSASASPTGGSYQGTLADGAQWIADVPSSWNGVLLLYSHGYGPPAAADAPDPTTQAALLGMGYALAGSSYDPSGPWWALGSAVSDQFQTLSTVEKTLLPRAPSAVYAVGTSMGGLISALEDQGADGRISGALTTCGLVGGALNLNQYQLDGEYAISQLLAPNEHIQLTNFTVGPPSFADSNTAAGELTAAAQAAQATAQGRARLALALSLMNVSPWGDAAQPGVYDFGAQEQGQFDDYTTGLFGSPVNAIDFIETARQQLELAAGGESAGTVGVDFTAIVHSSSYFPEIKALYREAGLSLESDLQELEGSANLRPDEAAARWLQRTSVPTGHLQVPELDIHTISDPLIPVQQEAYYASQVRQAGSADLLRQAFVQRQGHCAFTSAEIIAGLQALQARVGSGSWGSATSASALDAAADALPQDLGGGSYLPFWPERLTGAVPFASASQSWHASSRHGHGHAHKHARR